MLDLSGLASWRPPPGGIVTIEAHTAGEPFRVAVAGIPPIPGATILEKRRHAVAHLEPYRRALIHEPRGHADMYGCFLTEPTTPDADVGVLFIHNEGYSTMCGHGIIALATVLHRTGCHTGGPLRIETPAGLVTAEVHDGGRAVSFENVPSFVAATGCTTDVPGLGRVHFDVAFGGAFYAFVDADTVGLRLEPAESARLIEAGRRIREAVAASHPPAHPDDEDLGFLYGTIFTGPPGDRAHHSRHVCIFAEGELDRSPTGTGVSARVALLHARGELPAGRPIAIESILGSVFEATVLRPAPGIHATGIVPLVRGSAHLTGRCTWFVDASDPFPDGFFLR